jgi:hypothetical protein
MNKMESVIKYLMRMYNSLGIDDANHAEWVKGQKPKLVNNFNKHEGVKMLSNIMLNEDVLNASNVKHMIGLNVSQMDTIIAQLRLLFPIMTGGNILSKNNIYSSINFEQSGGNILPSSATRIRNILTRYITGGLISMNTINLLDMVKDHLSASGKGFNDEDFNMMKKKLNELKAQEFNLLKNLVYVNTMLNDVSGSNDYLNFNKAPTYELEGGAPSGSVSIIEKIMKKTKPESTNLINTISQLKELITGMNERINNIVGQNNNGNGANGVVVQEPQDN